MYARVAKIKWILSLKLIQLTLQVINVLNDLVKWAEMIYFENWLEKCISIVYSIIYMVDYPVIDGEEEWENWVRPQEEYLFRGIIGN